MRIRSSDPDRDAAACAAIYAPSVTDGLASFEVVAPDAGEMARRIAAAQVDHDWVVAVEDDDTVIGFAYAGRHNKRAGYRLSINVSAYVGAGHQGGGVGRALYATLLDRMQARGYLRVCAGITLPNPASVALHEGAGFVPVGVYRRIGFKFGAWHDVGWWQRTLGEDRDPPEDQA